MASSRGILGQSWNSEISAILPYDINFDLKSGSGSDTPTSAKAILHHTDQFYVLFCTRLYITGIERFIMADLRIIYCYLEAIVSIPIM